MLRSSFSHRLHEKPMSNDLREQLLKAGLVSEEQVKQAAREKQKPKKAPKVKKAERRKPTESDTQRAAEQARQQQIERDRVLNEAREQAKLRKAQREQIRRFARANRLNSPDGDLPFYFQVDQVIKHIYVTEAQYAELMQAKLGVAVVGETNYLLYLGDLEKLQSIGAEATIIIPEPESED